jgi:hypothetical protein
MITRLSIQKIMCKKESSSSELYIDILRSIDDHIDKTEELEV